MLHCAKGGLSLIPAENVKIFKKIPNRLVAAIDEGRARSINCKSSLSKAPYMLAIRTCSQRETSLRRLSWSRAFRQHRFT